ncbi:hypothetical protein BEWA_047570 [Theileria equi strain WA]|uniref:Uncharacterized protein n=1 Tax=Theileria equi strain WA TaxID=1537102 RepID=L1LA34_THEEQ|nr:hypothetical protein BEWA_047570 [Theileria equi strain WA]EKX72292.1 hypothetical protein BEWA_047570 [Theileria equi strain WA]|eukprot:XP_004831744.1 hypothetical protein BEWA_047570 [Theileria equi strain WA]
MTEGVTIDLKEKPPDKDGREEKTYDGDPLTITGMTIIVTRSLYPPSPLQGSSQDFYKYEHKDSGEQQFTLKGIQDDTGVVINVKGLRSVPEFPKDNVLSVSAYYWKHENGGSRKPKNVLIVEVVKKGHPNNETKYYVRSSVTINLTKDAYVEGKRYCCYNHIGKGKVTVIPGLVSCSQQHNSTHITYFKHSINNGYSLAGIEYNDDGNRSQRKKIKIPDIVLPTRQSVKVYVLYCTGNNPKLIYVDCGVRHAATGWYKNDRWQKTLNSVPDPEKIANCSHNEFNTLVSELKRNGGCGKVGDHPGSPQPPAKPTIPVPPISIEALSLEVASKYWAILLASRVPGATPITILASHPSASTLIKAFSELSGLSTQAITGISIASVGGIGLGALTVWKGPALIARLIARL